MEIRIATEADIPQLVSLVNSAYRGDSSKVGWTTEADILGGIRTDEPTLLEEMRQPGVTILKGTNEEGTIQSCVFSTTRTKYLSRNAHRIPVLQNKGIGKLFVTGKAEAFGKKKGCKSIDMTVISIRKELIAWYERHGYRDTGERKPFVEGVHIGNPMQPLEFIVMKNSLNGFLYFRQNLCYGSESTFEEAVAKQQNTQRKASNETFTQLYSLFKQALKAM